MTDGYNAITFPLKGPVGASFVLELQTMTSCSATSYKSSYTQLSGVTGSTQTFTVPLSSFSGANLNAINSILFESFSINGVWEIGQTQLVCANGQSSTPPTTPKPATTSKSSSVAISSSKSCL